MIYGHNSNVKVGANTFHVQTEDRGETQSLLDTTVYFRGRVLHRRTNNYFDLLPLNEDRSAALKMRLDEQHATVMEEIRNGALQLAIPGVVETANVTLSTNSPKQPPKVALPAAPPRLAIELLNPKTWLTGKHVTLQVQVKTETGEAAGSCKVTVHVEGSVEPDQFESQTGPNGKSQIEFDMPRMGSGDAAMVIRAASNVSVAKGQLRFSLKAKPRVPVA